MTYFEAQAFFSRGYRIREGIHARQARIIAWEEMSQSITAPIKEVVSFASTPNKKIENCVSNIVDLRAEIQDEILALVRTEREIAVAISDTFSDQTVRRLMEMRYLNCWKWETIAVELDLSYRWVLAKHKKALKLFCSKAR